MSNRLSALSSAAFAVGAAAASTGAPLTANAADLYGQPPPARWDGTSRDYGARPALWDGLYVGVHIGAGLPDLSFSTYSDRNVSDTSFLGGLQAGYNFSVGNVVAGVEFDLSVTDIDGGRSVDALRTGSASVNFLASARGRVGYAWNSMLFYMTGGLGIGGIETTLSSGGVQGSSDDWRYGWVYGGGVEMKIDPKISLRIEALHFDFGSESASYATGASKVDADVTSVRAGLTFHFN